MSRAYLLRVALALCALVCGPVHAHKDRILPITADGAIPDIPAAFGAVKVTLEGLGSPAPVVMLRIGAHQTRLPLCAARLIPSRSTADVKVTGSWYHDEARGLPYYINLHFFEPGRKPGRGDDSNVAFLFNLHDATLIHAKSFKAEPSGNGGQFSMIDVANNCSDAVGGRNDAI